MAANTIIEIVKDNVQTEISEAKMLIKILNPSEKTKTVLAGLQLHFTELAKEYPNNIQVISEV